MTRARFAMLACIFSGSLTFAQGVGSGIEEINRRHLPYVDVTLVMNIESVTLREYLKKSKEQLGLDTRTVFLVTLKDNGYTIETSEPAAKLAREDPSLTSALDDGHADVAMLLKYLKGFYFDTLLAPNVEQKSHTPSEDEYELNYEYRGMKWRNTYSLRDGLIAKALTYQSGSDAWEVEVDYRLVEKNGRQYLAGFKSDNRYHGFLFDYSVRYKSLGEYLVPIEFTVEVRSRDRKAKFVYEVCNQRIE